MYKIINGGTNYLPMYGLSKDAGWNQTEAGLGALCSGYPQGNQLAVTTEAYSEVPVGSSMVLPIGKEIAWIGMVLIHPDHRRQGLATSLTEMCIKKARLDMGKAVVGLDATPAGSTVYSRIGFKSSFRIWRSTINTDQLSNNKTKYSILPLDKLSACQHLYIPDRLDGLKIIHGLYPQGSWIVKEKGKITGLIMTRPGRLKPFIGPLLASAPEVAAALLDHVLAYWKESGFGEVFIDIPEDHFKTKSRWVNDLECNETAKDFVVNPKVVAERSLMRMYEVVNDETFVELNKRDSSMKLFTRNSDALKMAKDSIDLTEDYIKSEREMLSKTYATGGPELG